MKKLKRPCRRIAVFDVHRTLVMGTSVEIQLVRFLLKKKLLPSANLIRALYWIPRLIHRGFREAFLRNKFYLYGLDARHLDSLLPEFFDSQLKPLLSRKMLKEMRSLRREGFAVILISGTLDFILDYLINRFGADAGMGTRAEITDGKFSGKVIGVYPFFLEKVTALECVLDGHEVDYRESTAFADSWADVPLLSLFGRPVAMNPDWGLRKKAGKFGWPVVTESLKEHLGRRP
jgi:HAD superfamily hydrolase (TIGR01490 family)